MMASLNLWSEAVRRGASDLHIVAGHMPMLRIDGILTSVGEIVTEADTALLMKTFLTEAQWKEFSLSGDLDCSYMHSDGTRFRINCHRTSGMNAFAARVIPEKIPTPSELGMPSVVLDLCKNFDGLILFTGPTGSGKSTSLASILQELSMTTALNVITLEDPIEFRLQSDKGLVQQRELLTDFRSFPEGLKHVLRQDPDVVMVGEMRDLDSIALALTLAETGHLVLATLHTPNATQSIDRIVDVFPPHQQQQVRLQLSLSLRAIVAQRLLPKKGGGRIANREILVRNPAIGNIIRDNRLAELPSVLQTGQEDGMCTFEQDMKRLIKEGQVEE